MADITEEHIRQSNLIEGIDDPKEDEQSMVAWLILNGAPNLSLGLIHKVQKVVTLHQTDLAPNERGYIRGIAGNNVDVRVGGYNAPSYKLVPSLMDNWLLDYDYLGPWEAHVRFEKIHPFVDGNGRTGRMLMWWQEVKLGQEPTLIEADKRQEYYKKLVAGRSIKK